MRRVIQPSDQNRTKGLVPSDLMFKDTAFVYAAAMKVKSLGSQVETWASQPLPIPVSFQEHAVEGEHTDPGKLPGRYCRLFTRVRNGMRWHDMVVVRGIRWRVEKVEEKFHNRTGEFQYLEARAIYQGEPGSITKL